MVNGNRGPTHGTQMKNRQITRQDPAVLQQCLLYDPTRVITIPSATATETVQRQQQLTEPNGLNPELLTARIAVLEAHSAVTPRSTRRSAKVPNPSFDGKPENLRPLVANLTNKMRSNADDFETEETK